MSNPTPASENAPYGRCRDCGAPLTYEEYHNPPEIEGDDGPFSWPNICDYCATGIITATDDDDDE